MGRAPVKGQGAGGGCRTPLAGGEWELDKSLLSFQRVFPEMNFTTFTLQESELLERREAAVAESLPALSVVV